MGKVQKKVKKKTNNSVFSATHTYIKLTLVSFFFTFFSMHLSLNSKGEIKGLKAAKINDN